MTKQNFFLFFYNSIFITTLIPFLPYIFPFLPKILLGFNYTGWAWMVMFLVTLLCLFNIKKSNFPILIWLPWITYIILYLIFDYSFLGLQLTLQYLLPILVGVVASSFSYSIHSFQFIYKRFVRLILIIVILFLIGMIFRGRYTAATAQVPMLLSIGGAIFLGQYYTSRNIIYIFLFLTLFMVPVIEVTRMGIVTFLILMSAHFGETRIYRRVFYILSAILISFVVFYSESFQEKSFYSGHGSINEMSINYYESEEGTDFNTSGRSTWLYIIEEGLNKHPIWGNGPRSDNDAFKQAGFERGEVHNDYLSIRYNYGYVGLSLLLLAFILQYLSLYKRKNANKGSKYKWILWSSSMVLFFVLWAFMYSDNIMKYTIFFPVFFFAMIGILYSKYNDNIQLENIPLDKLSPKSKNT
jgi:hypothetical protein